MLFWHMRLDKEKIKRMKEACEFSWADIARLGKLQSRQHAYDKYKKGSMMSAEFFGKIFSVKPKDLIK